MVVVPAKRPVNFLSNKNILAEIHTCKASYGEYLEPEHVFFDIAVLDLSEVTAERLEEAAKKAKKPISELVIRHSTYSHIPLDPDRKPKSREKNRDNVALTFEPFRHYQLRDGALVEVGRSHWTGGFQNGHFTKDKGRLTNRMGVILNQMVERYATRPNWRNYSYVDEMKAFTLAHLCATALKFDETRFNNPFAYYTTIMENAFTRVLNDEKKQQDIRDDTLIVMGAAPSYTRQIDWELERMGLVEPPKLKKRPGRPRQSLQKAA
ncbi:hypothetical protein AV944_06630 [Sphingomonas sp. LK11]|uniref:hypothetical protein n=1 Tax=Sphingomonas sp. LK11 TaxID=1390395 RepID=UPI000972A4FC|nr:hypothetical protein [Sphingomonas sp. LK11]APX65572.1 hypothetical protein AV944_06630 [Sphingomonas sp. LK11]